MSLFDKFINKRKQKTKMIMGVSSLGDDYLQTYHDTKKVGILISPTNLSVLSKDIVTSKIRGLTDVLKVVNNPELLCVNSTQSYESNKHYLEKLIEKEKNTAINDLNYADIDFLDDIRINMSTSREFFLVLTFKNETKEQIRSSIRRTVQMLTEAQFIVKVADKNDLKRILSIYWENNIYSDTYPDYDGEQYITDLKGDE